MLTRWMPVNLIAFALAFAAVAERIAPADVLLTSDRSVFAATDVNEPGKQKTEDESDVEKFRRDVLSSIRSLRKDILAAKRAATRRQRQLRRLATAPDETGVRDAERKLGLAQEVLDEMLWEDVWELRYWHSNSSGGPFESGRYDYLGYPAPDGGVIITLESVDRAIVQATRELREAANPPVPIELLLLDARELEEYDAIEDLAQNSQKLCVEAVRALRALADRDSRKTEIEKWQRVLSESIKNVYDGLTKARGRTWMAKTQPVEPIGFFTIGAGGLKSRTAVGAGSKQSGQGVVVVARVRAEWFTPPKGSFYQNLRRDYKGLFPSSMRYRPLIFDSHRFKLVLKDGRSFRAAEFINPYTWGGDVVTGRYRLIFESGRSWGFDGVIDSGMWTSDVVFCTAERCIIWYRRNPPPVVTVRIVWLLDTKDSAAPFELQLDEFKPASVPDVRPDLPVSGAQLFRR